MPLTPEEQIQQMVDALLPPANPDTNVQTINEIELVRRFQTVDRELLRLGEVLNPKTQQARDLHSERAAYVIEMHRRGLR